MKVPEINLAEEKYIKYSIDETKEEVIIHFKESDVIMSLMDFNKLIEKRMENIGVIDEEIVHGNIIDLTENSYSKYEAWDKYDSIYLHFGEWKIEIDKRDLFRLVKDVEEKTVDPTDPPFIWADELSKREALLKELLKTIDEITDLTNRYDSTYFALLSDRECPSFKDDLEVKTKLLHMWKERNNKMAYREKLKAKLEYGELQ